MVITDSDKAVAATIAGFSLPIDMTIEESANHAVDSGLHEGPMFQRRSFHAAFALAARMKGMADFPETRKPVFVGAWKTCCNAPTEALLDQCYSNYLLILLFIFTEFFVALQ